MSIKKIKTAYKINNDKSKRDKDKEYNKNKNNNNNIKTTTTDAMVTTIFMTKKITKPKKTT